MVDRDAILAKLHKIGNPFYDEESKRSWDFYLGKAQQRRDPTTQRFASLDAIHIFVLCNIIGRPIIVYADISAKNNNNVYEVTEGIRYEGVYLPVLRQPKTCEKSPVLVGFNAGRFVPLFSTENQNLDVFRINPYPHSQHCAPLVREDSSPIPIRFLHPNEDSNALLQTFFDSVIIPTEKTTNDITSAILKFKAPNAQCIQLLWSMLDVISGYVQEDKLLNIQQNNLPPQQHYSTPIRQNNLQQQQQNQYPNDVSNQFQNMALHPNNMVLRDGVAAHQNNAQQQRDFPNQQQQHYPSPTPCVRRKADLCISGLNASENNNESMCDECYKELIKLRQQVKRRNKPPSVPQSMPPQQPQYTPQQPQYPPQLPQQQQQPQQHLQGYYSVPQQQPIDAYDHIVHHDLCIRCNKVKCIKELENKCKECFAESFIEKKRKEEPAYDSVGPPQPNIRQHQNKQIQGNCNQCGSEYFEPNEFALCGDCFEKIKRQQEEVEQKKSIEKVQQKIPSQGIERNAGFGPRDSGLGPGGAVNANYQIGFGNPGYPSGGAGVGGGPGGGGGSGYQIGFENGGAGSSGYQSGAGEGLGYQSGAGGYGAGGYGGVGSSGYEGAGVSGYGAAGGVAEEKAEQEIIRKKTICSVAGCMNPVQSFNGIECEKHIKNKKEKKPCWVCEKNPADDNAYNVCTYCVATQGNLIKEHDNKGQRINPNNVNNKRRPVQQQMNIPRGPVNAMPFPSHYENQPMDMDEVIDINSLPDLPQMMGGQQQRNNNVGQFSSYEGFNPNQKNFGGQQGQLPWQQQRINNNERRCMCCNNKASVNGLCGACYQNKTAGQQPQRSGIKCGNPDKLACKNFVDNPSEDFMCRECIREQQAGMEKVFKKEPEQPQHQQQPPYQNQQQQQQQLQYQNQQRYNIEKVCNIVVIVLLFLIPLERTIFCKRIRRWALVKLNHLITHILVV